MTCVKCNKQLSGKQLRYCSAHCKNGYGNTTFQHYAKQKVKGNSRRQQLIDSLGGCCAKCGYSKCSAALSFHHLDPSQKSFQLDVRNCSNRTMSSLQEEAKKCILLCANCHMEEHHS